MACCSGCPLPHSFRPSLAKQLMRSARNDAIRARDASVASVFLSETAAHAAEAAVGEEGARHANRTVAVGRVGTMVAVASAALVVRRVAIAPRPALVSRRATVSAAAMVRTARAGAAIRFVERRGNRAPTAPQAGSDAYREHVFAQPRVAPNARLAMRRPASVSQTRATTGHAATAPKAVIGAKLECAKRYRTRQLPHLRNAEGAATVRIASI